ncbi:MAG: energy-coupled thiamine transporter ThiT [Armatimonadetes bacterium]|nr:energy-coupled thiamine transporter ThiT [Armatimonadota bacterium]
MDTRAKVEIGILVALALLLSQIKLLRMPQGGEASLEMVPLLFLALRRGAKVGFLVGLVYGPLKFVLEPVSLHPLQIILDYPLAFCGLGAAGFFAGISGAWAKAAGTTLGVLLRFLCHTLSGAVFFAAFAPKGMNPWLYSSLYNASYLAPAFLVALFLLPYLLRKVPE